MKIYSIIIFKDDNIYKSVFNISDVSFLYRRNVKEFLIFLSKTVSSKYDGNKLFITEKQYNIHIDGHDNMVNVIITDIDYYNNVVMMIMNELNSNDDLDKIIKKYENPNDFDKIKKIKETINTTKIVVLDTIDKILERGQKIDDLIAKSDELSITSKEFYKEAKKTNSWCSNCLIC